jgi:hypothetical protein
MTNELTTMTGTKSLAFLEDAMRTMQGVSEFSKMMAQCGTMPDHLKDKPGECFRVVVQAAQWGMNPYTVADCTSLVHGRLCYEGKLVHAVLQAMGAIKGSLDFELSGKERTDQRTVTVVGVLRDGREKRISGTVADWKTEHKGSPWGRPGNYDRQLCYRGAREWARIYAPQALMGVYTPDEMVEAEPRDAEVMAVHDDAPPARTAAPDDRSEPSADVTQHDDQQPAQTATDPTDSAKTSAAADEQAHPAISICRSLYRELQNHERGTGPKLIGRLCRLHGAESATQVADDRLDQLGKDAQEMLDQIDRAEEVLVGFETIEAENT